MRRSLEILGVLVLAVASVAQGQDYWNPPSLANRNASGTWYYMLEVPAGIDMVADGYDDDWRWFDPQYAITQDGWRDEAERILPSSRSDLDLILRMAWKGAPDNRWYVFLHVHDDTLSHEGTNVARWDGDMIGIQIDYQDHGRTRGWSPCYGQEWIAAPGNVTSNFAYRYPEVAWGPGQWGPGQASWAAYALPPWMNSAVRVEPAAAWAADAWTSDTGGDTYYEFNVAVLRLLDDAGPAASAPGDLSAIAGIEGHGLPFNFFVEDGDPRFENDLTVRGAEASARQYFALARLLRVGEYVPAAGQSWSVALGVTNARDDSSVVHFGLVQGCTAGVDPGCGEVEMPPLPPLGAFDTRWQVAGTNGSQSDYRDLALTQATWVLALQAGGGYPVRLSWNPLSLPAAPSTRLVDTGTDGQLVDVDLRAQSAYELADESVNGLAVVYSASPPCTHTYDLPRGWSMVSLACSTQTGVPNRLFPPAISTFGFATGYFQVSTMAPCHGYWLNLAEPCQVTIEGIPCHCILDLPRGWSMVSPCADLSVAVLKAQYPAVTSVFGFGGGYFTATTMERGKGYWMNLSAPQRLELPSCCGAAEEIPPPTSTAGPTKAPRSRWAALSEPESWLWVEGPDGSQGLVLGVGGDELEELPPLPPAGLFDVRVELGNGADAWGVPAGGGWYRVRLQGEIARLRWEMPAGSTWQLELAGTVVPLVGSGQLVVNQGAEVRLRQLVAVLTANALHRPYPNPFNPSTTIRYELAAVAEVCLRVYSVAGQLVRELVATRQEPGAHQVTWDGRDSRGVLVGNGVYLCELQAGDYRAVRRLVVMR